MLFGVPQGSISGQDRCWSIFPYVICFTFFRILILRYMDYSTPYCAGKNAEFVGNNLQQSSIILFEWFNNNYMKVNTVKNHLLLSGNSRATTTIDNSYTEQEDEQVLPGIQLILTFFLKIISIVFARKQVKS